MRRIPRHGRPNLVAGLVLLILGGACGEERGAVGQESRLQRLAATSWTTRSLGVTRKNTPIDYATTGPDDPASEAPATRVLFVAQLDDRSLSQLLAQATRELALRIELPAELTRRLDRFAISCVPAVRPDLTAAVAVERPAPLEFPPAGPFYGTENNPEANYLWRWLGTHAPDLVVEVRRGERVRWTIPAAAGLAPLGEPPSRAWGDALASPLAAVRDVLPPRDLVTALGRDAPADVGLIPAILLETPMDQLSASLRGLFAALDHAKFAGPSPARRELQARANRRPLEVLRQLSAHYGQTLPAVEYIPAMALVGRLRLGRQTGDATQRQDVLRIVGPYLSGEKNTTPKSGSGQSGHLIFAELARDAAETDRPALLKLARVAADQGFSADGRPLDVMPFHAEMSDAFFMGAPILAATGKLTGETRYFQACARHLTFMKKTGLRSDGLYRHSPLDETAWGRGNGFVALGLALSLSDWPEDRSERREWIATADSHLRVLLKHQDAQGCWHQVVDGPESYAELSSTCMITFAMIRGVQRGWLERDAYEPHIRRAWEAIKQRTASDGRLIDVCTGTGKMKSRREYYDREALLGRDPRGGAMAMIVAAEMAEFAPAP